MADLDQRAVSFWGWVPKVTVGAPPGYPLLTGTDAEDGTSVNFVIVPPIDVDYDNTKIYQASGSGVFNILVETITTPATTGNVTELSNGVTYSFQAIAYNTANIKSLPSNVVRVKVTDGTLGYDPWVLQGGIIATYEASFLKGQIPLYYYMAPQKATFPYINFMTITSNTEDTMSDKQNKRLIQFDIYSGEKESAKQMMLWAAKLDKVFDETKIQLDGQTIIRINRINQTELKDPDWGYHYLIDYMFNYEEGE